MKYWPESQRQAAAPYRMTSTSRTVTRHSSQKFGAAGQQVVDVFDSTGQAIARVDSFPLNARGPLLFRGGRIYGFVTDPDGIKYLVALDIVR